jgi:hypothetical protein
LKFIQVRTAFLIFIPVIGNSMIFIEFPITGMKIKNAVLT